MKKVGILVGREVTFPESIINSINEKGKGEVVAEMVKIGGIRLDEEKKYDVIIMRDVIEHIPNQEIFLGFVKSFLKPEGKFFLAFPPWQNPFGGHQQICRSKILSVFPWFHLLPRPLYKFVLKAFGENEGTITALFEIKDTGISVERFERILKRENYKIDKRVFWFINPNYQTKFGLKPRKQTRIISSIPWVRGFFKRY